GIGQGLIGTDTERSPYHWGRTYQSPAYALRAAASVENVRASSTGRFYRDSETNQVWVKLPGGVSPASNGVYRSAGGSALNPPSQGEAGLIRIVGFDTFYGSQGFRFSDYAWYEGEDLM